MSGSNRAPPPFGNRRLLNASEVSTSSRSASLEMALLANLSLQERLENDFANESADFRLRRLLSIRSTISTTSSFAERQQGAVATRVHFREIGTGSIGKIFEHPGTIYAYKLPLTENLAKLWNNYVKHVRVQESFQSVPFYSGQVEIPRCFWFALAETEAFWQENLHRFPDSNQFPRAARPIMCMERIFPLPKPIRAALIEKYCPPRLQEQISSDEANKDCLIRPYLGRIKYGSGMQFFSLRNFQLHANQIEELGMDATELLRGMAHALAVLHWHTRIDANDVEFVLGSSPEEEQNVRSTIPLQRILNLKACSSTYEVATHSPVNFMKRVTSLWLIDFDDCNDITMDTAGVNAAIKAFLETNHYSPKPNTGNNFIDSLWLQFKTQYLYFSDTLLERFMAKPELKHLPREFLQGVEDSSTKKRTDSISQRGGRGNIPPRGNSARYGSSRDSSAGGPRRGSGSQRSQSWRGSRDSDATIDYTATEPYPPRK